METGDLKILVERHKLWLESDGAEGEKLNLSQRNLEGVRFSAISSSARNLACADFRGAALKGAGLVGINLAEADFEKADLQEALLVGANFDGTNLNDCNLNAADLEHSRNLTCHQIESARITRSTIIPSTFQITWISDLRFECVCIILPGANLAKKGFRHDDLSNANLKDAIMRECQLMETDLRGANLEGADLRQALFHKTMLDDANLRRANLSQTNLRNSRLEGANLVDADLSGTNLEYVRDLSIEQILSANINSDTILPDHLKKHRIPKNRKNSWNRTK